MLHPSDIKMSSFRYRSIVITRRPLVASWALAVRRVGDGTTSPNFPPPTPPSTFPCAASVVTVSYVYRKPFLRRGNQTLTQVLSTAVTQPSLGTFITTGPEALRDIDAVGDYDSSTNISSCLISSFRALHIDRMSSCIVSSAMPDLGLWKTQRSQYTSVCVFCCIVFALNR